HLVYLPLATLDVERLKRIEHRRRRPVELGRLLLLCQLQFGAGLDASASSGGLRFSRFAQLVGRFACTGHGSTPIELVYSSATRDRSSSTCRRAFRAFTCFSRSASRSSGVIAREVRASRSFSAASA